MKSKKSIYTGPPHKKRPEHKGDVRLLALSIAILVACIAGALLIRNRSADRKDINIQPDQAAQTVETGLVPEEFDERVADAADVTAASPLQDASVGVAAGPPSPEEREDALEEMADGIPEGQIIVY
jgi:hypothetical protein